MGISLKIISFSVVAFKIPSLSLIFGSFIILFLEKDLLKLSLFGDL